MSRLVKLCLLEDLVVDVDLDEARDEVGRAVRGRVRGVKWDLPLPLPLPLLLTPTPNPYPYPYP